MMYSALEDHKFRERFFEIYHCPPLRAISKAIETGIHKGIYRPVNPSFTTRSFFGVLLQYCISRFIASPPSEKPFSDGEVVDNLVNIFMNGLKVFTPEKGNRAHENSL